VELVEDDEGSQHVDRYTGCEFSYGICFDSRIKVRSPAKSDLVLPGGVPRVPKYYAMRRGYKQGVLKLQVLSRSFVVFEVGKLELGQSL
jgi:hypothetical protein